MKQYAKIAVLRGLTAAAGGPVVLAIIYGILGFTGEITSLLPGEVCMGVLTVTMMAFIAAAAGVVYQIDRLPLMYAIAIHALALYIDYLLVYLLNNWIPRSSSGIGIFTAIYFGLYALIWAFIFTFIQIKTRRLNRKLRRNQTSPDRSGEERA